MQHHVKSKLPCFSARLGPSSPHYLSLQGRMMQPRLHPSPAACLSDELSSFNKGTPSSTCYELPPSCSFMALKLEDLITTNYVNHGAEGLDMRSQPTQNFTKLGVDLTVSRKRCHERDIDYVSMSISSLPFFCEQRSRSNKHHYTYTVHVHTCMHAHSMFPNTS